MNNALLMPVPMHTTFPNSIPRARIMSMVPRLPFSFQHIIGALIQSPQHVGDELDASRDGWSLLRDPGMDARTTLHFSLQPALFQNEWTRDGPYEAAIMLCCLSKTGISMRMAFTETALHVLHGTGGRFHSVYRYNQPDEMKRWLDNCRPKQGEATRYFITRETLKVLVASITQGAGT